MNVTILVVVVSLLVLFAYRFYKYQRIYLIPQDIEIQFSDYDQERSMHQTHFTVTLQQGYLSKVKFYLNGSIETQFPLEYSQLKSILSTIEILKFHGCRIDASIGILPVFRFDHYLWLGGDKKEITILFGQEKRR